MWRGVTVAAPFLSGASMMRGGWFPTGKLVCYPIRDNVDGDGNQLINWVVEVETPEHLGRAWNRRGRLDDFAHRFEAWRFPWLDVPKLLAGAPEVLEYPMVDQDPLPRWSFGRVSLLGDAAHPMLPRGSNGAGQSILDAEALADSLAARPDDVPEALRVYEAARLPATSKVVLANRENPPDAILREVYLRSGDKPFDRIEDIIDPAEMTTMTAGYGKLAAAGRLAGSAGVGDPAMEVKADAARHSHVTGV